MMPDPLTPEQLEQIHNELFAGRKISAIKIYREATHIRLKEAKEAIEAMARDLYQRSPGRFTRDPNAKRGCGTAMLFFVVAAAALAIAGAHTLGS